MKYSKAAALVAGSVMALGVASPAFADDVDNAPAKDDNQLAKSSTVSNTDVKNPLKDVNAEVVVGALGKVADKLATKNDLASKTNALAGATKGASGSLPGSGLVGGMPIGG
ncbi:hypothetical protein [Streptomyces sp. NBC_01304]|uniref:hypothetical protein n=1 Tax=Streptomyces sp. NBC_01304 TaxID=2903818 RepID=UPI002E13AC22|nr:hypothetical protein OG430_31840 [Streptomyces sp. NBC_01304]